MAPLSGALRLLYEGKSKRIYAAGPGEALMVFKDEVTAFNGRYRDEAPGKGAYSAALTSRMFELLESYGIKTHYICYAGGNAVKIRLADVIPLEVIVRNYVYGSMKKRLPLLKEMDKLEPPVVELHYKDDRLGDPLLHPRDPVAAGILAEDELNAIEDLALRVNNALSSFWRDRGLTLVDFKIEVARDNSGFMVVDEITGDTMRLIDPEGRHYDKEVYRRTRSTELLLQSYVRLLEAAGNPSRRC